MRALLIGSYEMGRQPFGLASPAAFLEAAGHTVDCVDLSQEALSPESITAAGKIAFFVPMHTATRIAARAMEKVRQHAPDTPVCFYGLYAPMNADYLRSLGAAAILGGEFETALTDWVTGGTLPDEPIVLDKLAFVTPQRAHLPPLDRYAHLHHGDAKKVVGMTTATRGCKHLCRHCPVVPVYDGRFFTIDHNVVLADVSEQVSAGAQHITFADPDFFNAPRQAIQLVDTLHAKHPELTYDVTIKVSHLLKHRELLGELVRTGCAFVTTAVESFRNHVLEKLDKGHTAADAYAAFDACTSAGLPVAPTFVAFTPWTTRTDYERFLLTLHEIDLVQAVAPIQLALRLLIPSGSKILDVYKPGPFNQETLSYTWTHPDPEMDNLQRRLLALIEKTAGESRADVYLAVVRETFGHALDLDVPDRVTIPFLTEPWYC